MLGKTVLGDGIMGIILELLKENETYYQNFLMSMLSGPQWTGFWGMQQTQTSVKKNQWGI